MNLFNSSEDHYDDTNNKLLIGKKNDGTYEYEITLMSADQEAIDLAMELPTIEEFPEMENMTLIIETTVAD